MPDIITQASVSSALISRGFFDTSPTLAVRSETASPKRHGAWRPDRFGEVVSDPMTFSHDEVTRIARLARIDIDAAAAEDVRAKLDAIFTLINELLAIDTTGIEPMAHAQDVTLPMRDDAVTEVDRHALYQQSAPAVADGLYLVPKVIE